MNYFKEIVLSIKNNPIYFKIFYSIAITVLILLITKLIKSIIYRKVNDSVKYYSIKQVINYIVGILIIVLNFIIWLDSVSNVATYIGLLSAGIAIALKEVFTNIAGWILLEFRKPFEVSHRIMIGEQKGDVIDKRLFHFTLMEVSSFEDGEQSTGRIIDIPNSFVFTYAIVNYTKGFEYIWNEIKILLSFDSNWRKAKDNLLNIANKDTDITTEKVSKQIKNASKKYMIQYNKFTPIVYMDVKENGIQLTLRYLCEPKRRRITSNKIWEDVLDMIEQFSDIKLAKDERI